MSMKNLSDQKLIEEIRQRAIHIEKKVDWLLDQNVKIGTDIIGDNPDQTWGSRTFAQHGDDLIALALLDQVGINQPTYIDIGAHHPYNISNTALMYLRGSRGINIEPNPVLFKAFLAQRPEDINLNVGVSDQPGHLDFYFFDDRSGCNTFDPDRVIDLERESDIRVQRSMQLQVVTFHDIVKSHMNGAAPDFLTIDVEGFDLRILRSIDFEIYRPALICVEANSNEAAEQLIILLRNRNYEWAFRSLANLFFLDSGRRRRDFSH
jgi:FkbM family methyltransferase